MQDFFDAIRASGYKIVTAESCTGGLIASMITAQAGASDIFDRGFVTYSNEAKTELLGVPASLITEHGAVSEQVARAMAQGALGNSHADIAISVTGIAGPEGGSAQKPVGTVYTGYAIKRRDLYVRPHLFSGTRQEIQKQTAEAVIEHVTQALSNVKND